MDNLQIDGALSSMKILSKNTWIVCFCMLIAACMCLEPSEVWGQNTKQNTVKKQRKDADIMFSQFIAAYMNSDWEAIKGLRKDMFRLGRFLRGENRKIFQKTKTDWKKFRPKWWKSCSSQKAVSFNASMWGSTFKANYLPSGTTGFQAVVPEYRIMQDKQGNLWKVVVDIKVLVTWHPSRIDSKSQLGGGLANKHGLTMNDFAETVTWHELGHNYVTVALPKKDVLMLYMKHKDLYDRLQEFYADMTAIRHVGPHARRLPCLMRLNELDDRDDSDPHYSAARGVAALLVTEFMMHPEKWPSVHFPAELPEQEDLERYLFRYIYENWDKTWTIQEDLALRDLTEKYMRKEARNMLRKRGLMRLPNGQKMNLVPFNDRKMREEREAWYIKQLKVLRDSKRTDKKKTPKEEATARGLRIECPS